MNIQTTNLSWVTNCNYKYQWISISNLWSRFSFVKTKDQEQKEDVNAVDVPSFHWGRLEADKVLRVHFNILRFRKAI